MPAFLTEGAAREIASLSGLFPLAVSPPPVAWCLSATILGASHPDDALGC